MACGALVDHPTCIGDENRVDPGIGRLHICQGVGGSVGSWNVEFVEPPLKPHRAPGRDPQGCLAAYSGELGRGLGQDFGRVRDEKMNQPAVAERNVVHRRSNRDLVGIDRGHGRAKSAGVLRGGVIKARQELPVG